ncbi:MULTISPECIES: GNAT family N-acetyltransferase [Brucella/Ochrobactrum group]|uniref:N-acetyltransferase n=2 Tax=Ochrobactrum TaxID=528 RepID=A0A2P9HQG3_9HYPH|nr:MULTISPECIES: GNAT family N-acetyltransferase [Brucella]MCI1000255.1 N-acetyltransferase [Ochrobactrum sp. C6C9]RRD25047.1 N-acetyltransferase [Brucellaceae bacterium VT-16-1752]WHT42053.1 GNAT family N-acetyltransferase [Ochrobactrum sp. SSR]MDX4076782.1 GNAT family N-acetyltransferase [Brucella sp. NBRC 113783]NNU61744.1 N-acetyltransferase [[Ochrobactrum] soli]
MSGNIDIRKEDSSDGGRYVASLDGSEAEMTYTRLGPSLISVDHTRVPEAMRGKGAAQALAKNAILDARRNGWKIIPRCSFMHAQATRHPDWSDVITNG